MNHCANLLRVIIFLTVFRWLGNWRINNELLEFRQNKRWKKSIEISKDDKMNKDAMEMTMISGVCTRPSTIHFINDPEIANDLLEYFVQIDNKHCFAACLYTCSGISWRNKIIVLHSLSSSKFSKNILPK